MSICMTSPPGSRLMLEEVSRADKLWLLVRPNRRRALPMATAILYCLPMAVWRVGGIMHWLKLARVLPIVAIAGCATTPARQTPPPDYDSLRRQQDMVVAQVTPPSQ